MNPITRQEIFLANAAGESTQELKPITRLEHFLKNVADHVKSIGNGGGTGGGGGTSIDVTAQVGQTIVVKEVDANGKPTAWESADYQEKICGEGITTLLEGTFVVDMENGNLISTPFIPEAGISYVVVWNGVEHQCETKDTGEGVLALGNFVPLGLDDTGEPFMLAWVDGLVGAVVVYTLDESENVSFSVIGDGVISIPKKYLPHDVRTEDPSYFLMTLELQNWCFTKSNGFDIFSECDEWENTTLTKEHYDELHSIATRRTPIVNPMTGTIGVPNATDDMITVSFIAMFSSEATLMQLSLRWSDEENCVQKLYYSPLTT